MGNGYKISWTENALSELRNTLEYLKDNWSEKEIRNFVRKLDKRLNLIAIYPKLFSKSEIKKNIRRSVLTKHNVIYYRIHEKTIIILSLFDSRQHPLKLKL